MSDRLSRSHRVAFVVNVFLLLVTVVVVYKIKTRVDLGTEVLVVPVQVGVPREGVAGGSLTMGMTRDEVTARLGQPQIARRPGIDHRIVLELTPKVFAWVGFDARDAVRTIEFDLSESHREYAGEQQIAVLYKGRRYLLKPGMSREAVTQLFSPTQAIETILLPSSRNFIQLEDTGLRLDFEREGLTTATLGTYIQRFPK